MLSLYCAFLLLFQATGYPPPYPRAAATKLIENDRVLVWDVAWPKGTTPPMHRHAFDMTGIIYWPGDRIITKVDGTKRLISSKAGDVIWVVEGTTHVEEGTSDDSLRAVMIELKGSGPSGHSVEITGEPSFTCPTPLLNNDRVTVCAESGGSSVTARHFYRLDTAVIFTDNRAARAVFVRAGEARDDERVAPGTSTTVFEIK
jgi:hypothetical protein